MTNQSKGGGALLVVGILAVCGVILTLPGMTPDTATVFAIFALIAFVSIASFLSGRER
jgi:hypothetical protein